LTGVGSIYPAVLPGWTDLLLDREGRHVRGFIPKSGQDDLPPGLELGRLIRERILGGTSLGPRFAPEERIAPQQVAAVTDAGKQPAGGPADLGPGH
jgi:hypothetical protein